VIVPLRVVSCPRKPVRVAVDMHDPSAHDEAPLREAFAPFGAVVVPCDVHDPPAHVAEPSCVEVLPPVVVVVPVVVQRPPAHDDVALWSAPRLLVQVRVAAPASVAHAKDTSRAPTARSECMDVPFDEGLAGCRTVATASRGDVTGGSTASMHRYRSVAPA